MTLEIKQELIQELENKSSREAEKVLVEKSPLHARLEKVRVISQEKSELRLTLDQETIENLEKIKSLMSHKSPNANYADLIKLMSEMVLKRIDPERKEGRERKAAPTPKETTDRKETVNLNAAKSIRGSEKRAVTQMSRISKNQIRQLVWSKSKGRCCYIDSKSKRRCTSRFQLQIDHVIAKSKGGSDHLSNLQLLCREHNQFKGWD
jgi:5-methylcytosine-specific restriction endonuclease McrA